MRDNVTLEYSKSQKKFFKLYLKILRIRFDEFYRGEKFLNLVNI